MFTALKAVKGSKELLELLDGVGEYAKEGRKPVFEWAATVVNPSKIPSVIARASKGLDAGRGLFARERIPAMKVVAILTDGPVAEKPTDFADLRDGEEVLIVRRKAGNFSNLYQRGAFFVQLRKSKRELQTRGMGGGRIRRVIQGWPTVWP
jgi:hypothetical protein